MCGSLLLLGKPRGPSASLLRVRRSEVCQLPGDSLCLNVPTLQMPCQPAHCPPAPCTCAVQERTQCHW